MESKRPIDSTFPSAHRASADVSPVMIDALGAVNSVEFFKWSLPRMSALDRAHVIRTADAAIFRDKRYFSTLGDYASDVVTRLGVASVELVVRLLVAEPAQLSSDDRRRCCERIVAATAEEFDLDDMIALVVNGSRLDCRSFAPCDVVQAVATHVDAKRGPVEAFILFHRTDQWGATIPTLVPRVCAAVAESGALKQKLVSSVLDYETWRSGDLPCAANTAMWNYLQLVADINAGAHPFKTPRVRGLCRNYCFSCTQLLLQVNTQCVDDTVCTALMLAGPLRARAIVLEHLVHEYPARLLRCGLVEIEHVMCSLGAMYVLQRAELAAFIRASATPDQLLICLGRIPDAQTLFECRRRNAVYDAVLIASVERLPAQRDGTWLNLIRAGLYADAVRLMGTVIATTVNPNELRAEFSAVADKIPSRNHDADYTSFRNALREASQPTAFNQIREAAQQLSQQMAQMALAGQ